MIKSTVFQVTRHSIWHLQDEFYPKGFFALLTKNAMTRARIILRCRRKRQANSPNNRLFVTLCGGDASARCFDPLDTVNNLPEVFVTDSFQPFIEHNNVIHNHRYFTCLLCKAQQSFPEAFRLPGKPGKENKCLAMKTCTVAGRSSQGADS